MRRRYLQLPRTLPRRVIDQAHIAVSGATSAYDKAAALESYLRTNYTYTTHVAAVPPDQDWVDYFLFDSKQGYCDYFATAMVVMLRAEGIPARVASGFAPGELNPDTGISIVRENHAHSWVEVFFPRFGWINFEPSAIRPLPARVDEPQASPPTAVPAPSSVPDTSQLTPQELDELLNIRDQSPRAVEPPFWTTPVGIGLLGLLAILALGLIGLSVIAIAWRSGMTGLAAYQRPYAQLVRLGRWSGTLRPRTSDTPNELAERFGRQVPRARPAIAELTDAYVEGTYASRPPSHDPWPTWLAARRAIIRGLFGRRFGSWFGVDESKTLAPKSHPELLSRWGARRPPE
jgi:hypothetical protein